MIDNLSDNPKNAVEIIDSIMKSITSPAKLAFAGYVLLVYTEKIKPAPSVFEFLVVAAVFFVLQVLHDDYLRELLNKLAKENHPPDIIIKRTIVATCLAVLLIIIGLCFYSYFHKNTPSANSSIPVSPELRK